MREYGRIVLLPASEALEIVSGKRGAQREGEGDGGRPTCKADATQI